jgi:hypothetical protein
MGPHQRKHSDAALRRRRLQLQKLPGREPLSCDKEADGHIAIVASSYNDGFSDHIGGEASC